MSVDNDAHNNQVSLRVNRSIAFLNNHRRTACYAAKLQGLWNVYGPLNGLWHEPIQLSVVAIEQFVVGPHDATWYGLLRRPARLPVATQAFDLLENSTFRAGRVRLRRVRPLHLGS
jgi:hypothetical protein